MAKITVQTPTKQRNVWQRRILSQHKMSTALIGSAKLRRKEIIKSAANTYRHSAHGQQWGWEFNCHQSICFLPPVQRIAETLNNMVLLCVMWGHDQNFSFMTRIESHSNPVQLLTSGITRGRRGRVALCGTSKGAELPKGMAKKWKL